MLDEQNQQVLSWMRKSADGIIVVVSVNFTADPQQVKLNVQGATGKLHALLKSPGTADAASIDAISLAPYGVFVGELR